MKNKKFLLMSICSLLLPAAHAGTAYKWIDASGNVQYSQTPPAKNAKIAKTIAVADARYSYGNSLDDSESMQEQALRDAEQAHQDAVRAAVDNTRDPSVDAAVAAADAARRAIDAASKATERSRMQTIRDAYNSSLYVR